MARNDQIFFSTLGGAFALATILGAIVSSANSSTAPEWTQSILTACAVIAAVTIPLLAESRRRDSAHRVAEITIASALRTWLRVAAQEIGDNLEHLGTGGLEGDRNVSMPKFGIALGRIAEMRSRYVREVLALLERRERRQNTIFSAQYYGDETDGVMEYFEQISHLFWSVRRVYKDIAREHQLDEFTNRPEELTQVRHAEEKAQTYREIAEAKF